MRAITNIILFFIFFSGIFLFFLLLIPISYLGFYQAQMLSLIFDLSISIQNFPGIKSIIAYLILIKILNIFTNTQLFTTIQISAFISLISLFLSYYFFINLFNIDKKIKTFTILFYPVLFLLFAPTSIFAGYLSSFSLLISIIILFLFSKKQERKDKLQISILVVICWIALGFYWHSIQVMTIAIIAVYWVLITLYNNQNTRINQNSILFLIISVLFIVSWIYIKSSTFESSLSYFQLDFDFLKFLSKGALTNEYSFNSNLPIGFIDIIRYLSYFFTELIIGFISLKTLYIISIKEDLPKEYLLISSLFFAQLIMIPIYFFVTGASPIIIITTFFYPVIILLFLKQNQKSISFLTRTTILLIIFIPLIVTSIGTFYVYINNSPEQNIDFNNYISSVDWITSHYNKTTIYTDAHTGGNYRIALHSKNIDVNCDIISIGYQTYIDIISLNFINANDKILVINQQLYENHLIFESLESWNQFEPVNPNLINKNTNLNKFFSDGKIIIYG